MTRRSTVRLCSIAAATLAFSLAAQEPAPKPVPIRPQQPAAKTPTQDELKQKRAEKLAKPVFQKAPWLTDFDAAKKAAKERDALILTYFTRSYAH